MSFLQSSLFGRDFVNYRKNCAHYERTKFSSKVRNENKIPIVIDSIDESISKILGENDNSINKNKKYGREYVLHADTTIDEFINKINNDIKDFLPSVKSGIFVGKKIRLGLEDGTIINNSSFTVGNMYKKHKNNKDNILYFLVTQETTMYGYIVSILIYLGIFSNS
jgi:hypothetical protein